MNRGNRSISIGVLHPDEMDALLRLYVDLFHDREPLTKCLGFSKDRMISIARSVYAGTDSNVLSHGLCWIARDASAGNKGVGFVVCEDPSVAGSPQLPDDLADQEVEMVEAVIALLDTVRRPARDALGDGKGATLHIAAVGVAPGYEGQGIARDLLQTALSAAAELGFKYAFSECTSSASRRLHEKCGFEQLHSVSLCQLEVNGRRPFADSELDVYLMRKTLGKGKRC